MTDILLDSLENENILGDVQEANRLLKSEIMLQGYIHGHTHNHFQAVDSIRQCV